MTTAQDGEKLVFSMAVENSALSAEQKAALKSNPTQVETKIESTKVKFLKDLFGAIIRTGAGLNNVNGIEFTDVYEELIQGIRKARQNHPDQTATVSSVADEEVVTQIIDSIGARLLEKRPIMARIAKETLDGRTLHSNNADFAHLDKDVFMQNLSEVVHDLVVTKSK